MAPTPVPPPSVASNLSSTPANALPSTISLVSVLKDLGSLIYAIALPKTKTAKTCTIQLDTLHKARNLITSAIDAHDQHHNAPQISSIIEQLDAISNHIGLTPKVTPPPPVPKPIHRDTRLHVTLLQVNRQDPVLHNHSNADLASDAVSACLNSGCPVEINPDPDDDGPDIGPNIRAAGRHRSGDIWLQCATEEDRDHLIRNASTWIPAFSPGLKLSIPTYPVVVHGFPTSFDPSRDSDDIAYLLQCNPDLIPHPSVLQHAEFISRKNIAATKTHSSLVLYLTDPTVANNCIDKQIVYDGDIYRTVKFIRRPPQCYNCHRYGHFARDCRSHTTCGLCAGTHHTQDCQCGRPNCTNVKSCNHISLKCSLCAGAHAATSMDCPHRQAMLKRHRQSLSASGIFH